MTLFKGHVSVKAIYQQILDTETAFESCRREIEKLKNIAPEEEVKTLFRGLANTLFYSVIIMYTHRGVWLKPHFWHHYASSGNPDELAEGGNKEIMHRSLFQIYEDLYFHIEVIFGKYLQGIGATTKDGLKYNEVLKNLKNCNFLSNNADFLEGCKVVQYTRNSIHANLGMFIFAHNDEDIYYNKKCYSFEKGKTVSVSYEFLSEFISNVVTVCKGLFNTV